MPEGDGASSTGAETASMVPNQIAALVPTFDPAKDDLQVYSQKVMLLLDAWPAAKYTELTTRLILNCSGSAFMKLQLHQSELMENERKSVKRLVEILGGHWGQIGLEKRYEHAERALYRCVQKTDESADSFLARADIMWTELNSKNMNLSDLQAYVTLKVQHCRLMIRRRSLLMQIPPVLESCQFRESAVPFACWGPDSSKM
jgi:hypothetical protein